jgi:hypothetical protein
MRPRTHSYHRLALLFGWVLVCLHSVGLAQKDSLAFEKLTDHPLYELQGYTTYRLYYFPADTTDAVQMVWGDSLNPSLIETEGGFWQSPYGGCFSTDVNPALLEYAPELFYDSWLALGADRALPGGDKPSKAEHPQDLWSRKFDYKVPLEEHGFR